RRRLAFGWAEHRSALAAGGVEADLRDAGRPRRDRGRLDGARGGRPGARNPRAGQGGRVTPRPASALAALAAVGLALAACGGSGSTGGVAGARKTTALSFKQVVSGLDAPTYVTSAPGDPDTLYVAEQPGTIRIVQNGRI